ncbi:hypothetical protein [Flavivirga jejuensis]|uniref:Uncharacterized protein n=1 Tax=Flavivirga jejuensis TaxID=870487 RepID=A0ABT8WUJ3_9FLAO|nr:hypothetical protein [Flavivirga jejuensis]MDO5976527.1 hypothetical protein [Flavivirga jejuensis]
MKKNINLFALFDSGTNTMDNRDDTSEEIIDDIIVTLSGGPAPVSPIGDEPPNLISVGLHNTDVISFTVKASALKFDDLSVNYFQTCSNNDDSNSPEYMLHIKEVSGLKFIRVYNNLRQKMLQSKIKKSDAKHLKKGLYFFENLRFSRVQKLKKYEEVGLEHVKII